MTLQAHPMGFSGELRAFQEEKKGNTGEKKGKIKSCLADYNILLFLLFSMFYINKSHLPSSSALGFWRKKSEYIRNPPPGQFLDVPELWDYFLITRFWSDLL
jgi:hypothetical protein